MMYDCFELQHVHIILTTQTFHFHNHQSVASLPGARMKILVVIVSKFSVIFFVQKTRNVEEFLKRRGNVRELTKTHIVRENVFTR